MKFHLKSLEHCRFLERETRKQHYMVRMDSSKDHVVQSHSSPFISSLFCREEGKEMFLASRIFHGRCFISSLRLILPSFNRFNKSVASVFKYTMTSLSDLV